MTNELRTPAGMPRIQPVRATVANYNQMALLLDASGSENKLMPDTGKSIWNHTKEAFELALDSLTGAEENVIAGRLYISVSVFQGDDVVNILPSTLLTEVDRAALTARLDAIVPSGKTPMGKAIQTTLTRLSGERNLLRKKHTMGYPSLVILSDGEPTDHDAMQEAYSMVDAALKAPGGRQHLTVVPIHIAAHPEETCRALERLVRNDAHTGVTLLHSGKDFCKFVHLVEQTAVAQTAVSRDAGATAHAAATPFTSVPLSEFGSRVSSRK